jgi:hypothetical protein
MLYEANVSYNRDGLLVHFPRNTGLIFWGFLPEKERSPRGGANVKFCIMQKILKEKTPPFLHFTPV